MLSKVYATVYFACSDDVIRRFDRLTVSQQDLMELFTFGLDQVDAICGKRDSPAEVCKWTGMMCNADGEFKEFEWIFNHQDGGGTLGFEFLPWSMEIVEMFRNTLSGTIRLSDLPGKMNEVVLYYNQLTGSLDLDTLPDEVRRLHLSENQFTADPTKGHFSVVGWTSTPVLGEARSLPNSRRVSVLAPTLSTAAARWWVRTSTHPWGGSGNRRLLIWGIPDPPGGETRERPLILCGRKSGRN
ncbi:polygalacturonase inhibitor [Perkinsela sp. CCAP 1560/4]|nr:polygalacturonase inhibitor [Perkinsela sp. CCAP 1560/4]|eukprot:KNH05371.1 polygalacturonase inhibitor [Perkinsela sp. CCAP 1560/4]